jgi:hypothetical protein
MEAVVDLWAGVEYLSDADLLSDRRRFMVNNRDCLRAFLCLDEGWQEDLLGRDAMIQLFFDSGVTIYDVLSSCTDDMARAVQESRISDLFALSNVRLSGSQRNRLWLCRDAYQGARAREAVAVAAAVGADNIRSAQSESRSSHIRMPNQAYAVILETAALARSLGLDTYGKYMQYSTRVSEGLVDKDGHPYEQREDKDGNVVKVILECYTCSPVS